MDWSHRINQAETKLTSIESSLLPDLKNLVQKNQVDISKRACAGDTMAKEDVQRLVISTLDAVGTDLEKKSDKKDEHMMNQKVGSVIRDIASIKDNLRTKAEIVVSCVTYTLFCIGFCGVDLIPGCLLSQEMDKKKSISDVNQALHDVGEVFDKAAKQADIDRHELLKLQNMVSTSPKEIGQWKWSGHLEQNGSVTWIHECKNSNPENLVWESSQVCD